MRPTTWRPTTWRPGARRCGLAIGLLALVAAFALARHYGGDLLSLATLRTHRAALGGWVRAHAVLAALAYVAAYALAAGLCLPGAVFLTMAGGLLFGAVLGTTLTVLGATAGAVFAFLVARATFRTAPGAAGLDRLGPQAARLAAAIRRNAWSYLLVLRLVPIFPFVLVNIVPALLGVRLKVYALTTLIGIVPASFAFSLTGAGLGALLDAGDAPDLRTALSPRVLAALVALAALALAGIPLRARFAANPAPVDPPA